ncbi:MAG: glycoside hydrolase family 38 C-terminal domain-containing protein [Kiritimatiellae bacterium]|nr:glycoside hydrolase family 38 C-terminal domain-containing protein [Kiritimatiellia bacterium]
MKKTIKKQVVVKTFGAFHYDVAYRKTFDDYLKITLPIIDAGLDMLTRYPRFIFVVEQAILMREYLERNPTARDHVRELARTGRLIFAPGMFTMPDVNIPSGESFIRNYQLGREWLMANLGVEPKICWMADIFGHHAQIPQLSRACGYIAYLYERGKTQGDDTLYWWQGLDGTRLLTQWQIDTYYGLGTAMVPYLSSRGGKWMANFFEKAQLDLMHRNSAVKETLLSAIGGDFRMPEDSIMDYIAGYNRLNRKYHIEFGSPEQFFENVIRGHGEDLPVLKDDFNPLMQGTYSSRIRIKQANRRLENAVAALEMLEGFAGAPAPAAVGPQLWETIAWNAFHDIIAGSLEDGALREALHDYARGERLARQSLAAAMLAAGVRKRAAPAGRRADLAVTIFNSLPYERTEVVEIPLKGLGRKVDDVEIADADGRSVECQLLHVAPGAAQVLDTLGKEIKGVKQIRQDAGREAIVLARVKAAPGSLRTFGLRLRAGRPSVATRGLKVSERLLENRYIKAVLGSNGTIVSLIDKLHDCELALPDRGEFTSKGMNNIMLQPDMGDLWLTGRGPQNGTQLYASALPDPMAPSGIEYQRRAAVGIASADADAIRWPDMRVAEAGPLRATIRVHYPDTNVTTFISLARDERLLRFRTHFMPSGKRYRLRVAFPTAIRNGRIRTSIPCGHMTRPEGEYAAQDWMDYSDGKRGLCLLNRGLPGNNVTDGVMLLSLFRAVGMEDAGGQTTYEEGVEQIFEYALHPFAPRESDYHPARLGACFNRPLHTAFPERGQSWPEADSMIALDAGHFELMAYRMAGDELEIRIYESEGRSGRVGITLPRAIRACRQTDARGESCPDPTFKIAGNGVQVRARPFEIVTLRVAF